MAKLKIVKDAKTVKDKGIKSKLKNFNELKACYDLPEDPLTANLIIHKMSEYVEFCLKMIQQILQPEEFHALYECTAFDDDDKAELFDIYKRLITTHRTLIISVINADEKVSIEDINRAHKDITLIKPKMIDALVKMRDSWSAGSAKDLKKSSAHYFG